MASSRPAPSKPRKRASGASNGTSPKAKSSSSRSSNASARSKSAASTRSRAKTTRAKSADSGASKPSAAATVKDVAGKAAGPAIAVGAAAAGVAGGLVLRNRMRHKTVLGMQVPRSLGKGRLPDLDVKSIAKTVGEASQSFAKTSKTVSADLERAGDRAERIGKILS